MTDQRDIRKKLDELNRKPVSEKGQGELLEEIRRIFQKSPKQEAGTPKKTRETSPIVYKRDLPRYSPKSSLPSVRPDAMVVLEEATAGEEVLCEDFGTAYLVRNPVRNSDGDPACISEALKTALLAGDSPIRRRLSHFIGPEEIHPGNMMFMDIETTGLGNSPVFLVGMMVWEDAGLVVRQFLARDYSEEPGIVHQFVRTMSEKKILVTFNGKSFDLPYLRTRAAAVGVPFGAKTHHLDLLHVARRVWSDKLPNCKLQTLEAFICGRVREGDIPGSEIPKAYHDFVRTKNAAQMVEIMRHNFLDLVTLADLLTKLPETR